MINIGMAVSFNIEGQAYSFPDWSTESTSKQMVDILTEIAKANGVSGKALAELKKTNEDMLKATTKANKKEEKTAEEHKELTEEQKKAIEIEQQFTKIPKPILDKTFFHSSSNIQTINNLIFLFNRS